MNEFTDRQLHRLTLFGRMRKTFGGLQAYGLWQDHFAVYLLRRRSALEPTREAVRSA